MENLPAHVSIVFIITTLITLLLFYRASRNSLITLVVMSVWLLMQALIARTGFYLNFESMPPRFIVMTLPPLLMILILFFTEKGRRYIDSLDLKFLTILHFVRIPVELVLLWLFMNKAIPKVMTFEGANFDILSGLSAPIIYYIAFVKKSIGRKALLIWNFICLVLLFNIVITAVLSAPLPIQQFGFDQPNIGVFYFPFNWLPCFIVPTVLLSHLASIRQLLKAEAAPEKLN
jgi:hypothetical protein